MKQKSSAMQKDLLAFIQKSPSCFHVVHNLEEVLTEAGFRKLSEKEEWTLSAGGNYYVTRNDSSIVAFRIPKKEAGGYHMVASHSDSPAFKVKENPEKKVENSYVLLNTEKYGGMILSTWFDRPLSVAGRVIVRGEDGKLKSELVNLDQDLCVIPSLAIHMNPNVNKGMEYNPQVDMLPLFGLAESDETEAAKGAEKVTAANSGMAQNLPEAGSEKTAGKGLLAMAANSLEMDAEEILAHDLFLYVRDEGRILGGDGELLLCPRLDDQACAYTSMKAFAMTEPADYVTVCAVFDNEEVGSGTKQGADSTFLSDVLERVTDGLPKECVSGSRGHLLKRLLADSFLISADNAHAVHPAHPEKADPTNRPVLNGGIVIKFHGGQKYTTDAFSAARIKELCRQAGIPFQTYANRSDIAGGSTLGNISTAHVSVPSADIGIAQLAMHSANETIGAKDVEDVCLLFEQFFRE